MSLLFYIFIACKLSFIIYFYPKQVFAVQHVDVCMFSNGKFKNIVAESETNANELTVRSGETLHKAYTLNPQRGECGITFVFYNDIYIRAFRI